VDASVSFWKKKMPEKIYTSKEDRAIPKHHRLANAFA